MASGEAPSLGALSKAPETSVCVLGALFSGTWWSVDGVFREMVGGLRKVNISLCRRSVRRAPFGDPEEFKENGSGDGYDRFTGNPVR
jgi:hypothetical protein